MELTELTQEVLADWCDALLRHQIWDPDVPARHGALMCPACDMIHGRCWEAAYPLMHRAKATGNRSYLDAAVRLVEWSNTITTEDGAWSNDLDPTSWLGTTIFGAIVLAEALHHHSDLLSATQRTQWHARLRQAADGYLWRDFVSLDFTNVNYGLSAVYGFNLIGRVLGEHKYIERSEQLARHIPEYFTEPHSLLFGEGKPTRGVSACGLRAVDLGYNVEESLNGVVLYALERNDEQLLSLAQRSMESHLAFMLPDGGWDNSWGTRQFKWTYWGSRTTDGCQPAYAMMADRNPAFGAAALRNAELLAAATANGLLHGGPHNAARGVEPCIHHTFAHAKAFAFLQDNQARLPRFDPAAPLPRAIAHDVQHFPEVAVWLASRGPWRATVSAYDSLYRTGSDPDHILQATGGSLSVLHHDRLGTVLSGSMARYIRVEPRNQQASITPDFPLTPRIETVWEGRRFTNIHDLDAQVNVSDDGNVIVFNVDATLEDEDHQALGELGVGVNLRYTLEADSAIISASYEAGDFVSDPIELILPIVSRSDEIVRHVTPQRIEVTKPTGVLVIEATTSLRIAETGTESDRVFNLVPGFEALPIVVSLDASMGATAQCALSTRITGTTPLVR
ncbi:hypothetical protein [Microbacterium marmarense]